MRSASPRTIRSPLPPPARRAHSKLVLAVGLEDDEAIWEEEECSNLSDIPPSETFVIGEVEPDGGLGDICSPHQHVGRSDSNGSFPVVGEELADDCSSISQLPRKVRCFKVAAHFIRAEPTAVTIPRHDMSQVHWQICDELDEGIVVANAPNFFRVCFADQIPEETVAAKVNLSRLETGPTWRDFLRFSVEHQQEGRRPLDSMLECPCCLCILRRPVALPCGHSLCRVCSMRLPFSSLGNRRCPLCRAIIPHIHLNVNEPLDAVTEALRACQKAQEKSQDHFASLTENSRRSCSSQYSFRST